jgi:RNA polymerase sigma-70 factor (ECF subfamily)
MLSEAERLLISEIRKGDQRAWSQLIDRYEGRLQAFAYGRLRDRSLAEDVVQETFIGFANSLHNFDESRELQTYLFTIAAYKITDQLRKKSRKPMQTGEAAEERLLEKEDSNQRRASSAARSRERQAHEATAITRALKEFVQSLIEKQDFIRLKVLELLFVKGWANRVIAQHLHISEQQVANYRFAAVKKVTEKIRGSGLSPDLFPELTETEE